MSKYGFVNNGFNQQMGSQQPVPGLDNPYLQQLQQRLAEAQQMQQQLQQNPGSVSPMQMMQQMSGQSQMPQQMQQQVPQQQVQQQTQQPQVSVEGQAVLALFEDFAKTEDGKQLVSLMGKFNSFCQSQVAKAQNGGNNS
ncbi:cAMP-dependent protein kinase catalytic subunit [Escherichia phage vB_EcoS_ESCO40]|uniref:cAMP-dependent protein kinase catalytic subunit n=1 Tax=Escherichia phage vB_EcoS_ESCO40 TaxID=2918880 RepID=A0AAE9HJR2_9CAUD|nr:cAMP-dependent protein kinase catalytic subunit [Escherichia phage vB_EcoS_ESCO40]